MIGEHRPVLTRCQVHVPELIVKIRNRQWWPGSIDGACPSTSVAVFVIVHQEQTGGIDDRPKSERMPFHCEADRYITDRGSFGIGGVNVEVWFAVQLYTTAC